MAELLASGTLAANLAGFLIAAGLFLLFVFLAYRISEHVSRGVVFAAVFALLFVVAWAQELAAATSDVAVSIMMVLAALGRAALAVIGGNELAAGEMNVKRMADSTSEKVPFAKAAEYFSAK